MMEDRNPFFSRLILSFESIPESDEEKDDKELEESKGTTPIFWDSRISTDSDYVTLNNQSDESSENNDSRFYSGTKFDNPMSPDYFERFSFESIESPCSNPPTFMSQTSDYYDKVMTKSPPRRLSFTCDGIKLPFQESTQNFADSPSPSKNIFSFEDIETMDKKFTEISKYQSSDKEEVDVPVEESPEQPDYLVSSLHDITNDVECMLAVLNETKGLIDQLCDSEKLDAMTSSNHDAMTSSTMTSSESNNNSIKEMEDYIDDKWYELGMDDFIPNCFYKDQKISKFSNDSELTEAMDTILKPEKTKRDAIKDMLYEDKMYDLLCEVVHTKRQRALDNLRLKTRIRNLERENARSNDDTKQFENKPKCENKMADFSYENNTRTEKWDTFESEVDKTRGKQSDVKAPPTQRIDPHDSHLSLNGSADANNNTVSSINNIKEDLDLIFFDSLSNEKDVNTKDKTGNIMNQSPKRIKRDSSFILDKEHTSYDMGNTIDLVNKDEDNFDLNVFNSTSNSDENEENTKFKSKPSFKSLEQHNSTESNDDIIIRLMDVNRENLVINLFDSPNNEMNADENEECKMHDPCTKNINQFPRFPLTGETTENKKESSSNTSVNEDKELFDLNLVDLNNKNTDEKKEGCKFQVKPCIESIDLGSRFPPNEDPNENYEYNSIDSVNELEEKLDFNLSNSIRIERNTDKNDESMKRREKQTEKDTKEQTENQTEKDTKEEETMLGVKSTNYSSDSSENVFCTAADNLFNSINNERNSDEKEESMKFQTNKNTNKEEEAMLVVKKTDYLSDSCENVFCTAADILFNSINNEKNAGKNKEGTKLKEEPSTRGMDRDSVDLSYQEGEGTKNNQDNTNISGNDEKKNLDSNLQDLSKRDSDENEISIKVDTKQEERDYVVKEKKNGSSDSNENAFGTTTDNVSIESFVNLSTSDFINDETDIEDDDVFL